MSKNLAKRNFIAYTILAILLIVLCYANFAIPTTTSRFVGFVPAITTDMDIGGGFASNYSITYGDEVVDNKEELDRTVDMLNTKLSAFGYEGAKVSVGSNNNLYVELPKIKQATSILGAIATSGELIITTESSVEGADKEKAITYKEVVDVSSQFAQITANSYSWGINIDLNNAGKTKLYNLTSSGSGTLYIFVGDKQVSGITISSQLNTNSLYFYGTSNSQDTANVTTLAILMGIYGAEFDMYNNEILDTAPAMGENITTLIYIVLAIVSIILLALTFIMFREFGLIVLLNFVFFMTLTAFFMQAIPIFVLSFSAIVALVLGILMFFASNYLIFASAKKGYAEGKKLPLATKLGIKNNTLKIVDISVVSIILGIILFFVGGTFVQSFAITIAICGSLNLLTSLALNKLFTKWYTTINSKNAKRVNFKREAQVNELD